MLLFEIIISKVKKLFNYKIPKEKVFLAFALFLLIEGDCVSFGFKEAISRFLCLRYCTMADGLFFFSNKKLNSQRQSLKAVLIVFYFKMLLRLLKVILVRVVLYQPLDFFQILEIVLSKKVKLPNDFKFARIYYKNRYIVKFQIFWSITILWRFNQIKLYQQEKTKIC